MRTAPATSRLASNYRLAANYLASTVAALALAVASLTAHAGISYAPAPSHAIPASTAIPARFDRSIDTRKAKPGDAVTAKTIQVVTLPDGTRIAKGSTLTGHVVGLEAFHFDQTPYAHQKPSELSIHFDSLRNGNTNLPVSLSLRAIANTIDSEQASYPHGIDETDHLGTMTLIGGATFSPLDKTILSADGDAIGYNRKDGVFARLAASGSCKATDSEQSVAIFSPNACGAYGFDRDYLASSGQDGSGTFTLAVRGHSVKLYAGTTALLQVNEAR